MTDPSLRQLYLDYDHAHDLDPRDPFLADLARRIVDATTQRYGTGDLPGQATGSEIPRLIQGAVNAASPAWQRLDELIRDELQRDPKAPALGAAPRCNKAGSDRLRGPPGWDGADPVPGQFDVSTGCYPSTNTMSNLRMRSGSAIRLISTIVPLSVPDRTRVFLDPRTDETCEWRNDDQAHEDAVDGVQRTGAFACGDVCARRQRDHGSRRSKERGHHHHPIPDRPAERLARI